MKMTYWFAMLALIASVSVPAMAFDFNAVAVSGRPTGDPLGPQLDVGIDFSTFRGFSVNGSGQVAFTADLSGPGIESEEDFENDTAIWRWTAGTKNLLVREGDQAPGLPDGVHVDRLSSNVNQANGRELTDDGFVMGYMFLKGAGVSEGLNDKAFVRVDGPNVGLKVFRSGDLVPSTFLLMTTAHQSPSMPTRDSSGHILFRVELAGPGVTALSNDALVIGTDDNYSLLVREGQQPAGLVSNFVYRDFPQAAMAFSGSHFAFQANLHDNNDSNPNSVFSALFAGTPDSIQPVAVPGDLLPDGSGNYTNIGRPRINATGNILFDANNGYLTGSLAEGFQFIAKQGQVAPGTSETFGILGSGTSGPTGSQLTASGLVAFKATVSGASNRNEGIWVHDGSSLELAIREGDAAGSLADVTLGALQEWAFNDLGNLVVRTSLVGPGVSSANDSALWLVNLTGQMNLLLREGDLIDVDPSVGVDERTISSLVIGGRDVLNSFAARTNGLTDNNWLAVGLSFDDGSSGIFVTNVTVPEPASLVNLGLGGLLLLGLRRGNCRATART